MSTPSGGAPGLRGRIDRLPGPALFIITAGVLIGLAVLSHVLDHRIDSAYVVLRSVVALLIAGVTTWRITRTRRAVGGAAGFAALRLALRSGELPPGVPAQGWQEELSRREAALRRSRWLVPLLCALLVLLGVAVAVETPHGAAAGALLIAVSVALCAITFVRAAQVLPRIASLRTQLAARR